jgi:hypothetical protein
VGTIATLISSIANITAICVLKGFEPAFVIFPFELSPLTTGMSFMLHSRCNFLRRNTALYTKSVPQKIDLLGVTSVSQAEEDLEFSIVACAFHHRNSRICCLSPNARQLDIIPNASHGSNRGPSHVRFAKQAVSSHNDATKKDDNGEITARREEGPLAKACQVVSQLNQSNHNSSGHSRNGGEIEMCSYGPGLRKANNGPRDGIMVSYDVWRAVEET